MLKKFCFFLFKFLSLFSGKGLYNKLYYMMKFKNEKGFEYLKSIFPEKYFKIGKQNKFVLNDEYQCFFLKKRNKEYGAFFIKNCFSKMHFYFYKDLNIEDEDILDIKNIKDFFLKEIKKFNFYKKLNESDKLLLKEIKLSINEETRGKKIFCSRKNLRKDKRRM